jgi:cytochrome c553
MRASLRLALRAAILAVLLPAAGHADGGDPDRGFAAKVGYCNDCHGESGRGYIGWYPMPRIAGQQPEYFAEQLKDFAKKNRENDIAILMYKVHDVSPALGKALARHYRGLHPEPFGDAPKGLIERGRRIYEEGIPSANVPACSACHGPNAQGEGENPRLAGQLYSYMVKELINWTKERGQLKKDPGEELMTPIATAMSKEQIKAVSAYLASKR